MPPQINAPSTQVTGANGTRNGRVQIRARVAQHQHADAHAGERQQDAHRDQLAEDVEREQAGDHRREDTS